MSGITTLCFAGSYAVALGLELARLGWRGRARGVLAIGFAVAGIVAETLYLGYRAAMAESVPLSSAYEWFLLAAWGLVAVYLYLSLFHPAAASGVFILPLALALVAAAQYASKKPFPQSPATQVWGAIHGAFLVLGAVAVIFGFVAGVMYLLQSSRLKRLSQSHRQGGQSPFFPTTIAAMVPAKKGTVPGLRLPSLEWLERANGRAILISVLMTGAGLVSGIVINLINHWHQRDELPWTDPIVWESAGLFGWLLAAALFNALYRPARRGRKVAYLTVASFVFLAIFLAAQLFNRSEHDGKYEVRSTKYETGDEGKYEVRSTKYESGNYAASGRALS
ncbi:MAG TPA: cytochrome c biogenesis protein CcsA [Pirellulales bacterium]|jgi:ABC-type transport system involved in cytochrome c biogenesis permease subunit|nr:cytochrome c biogenesis protein CcsA [Pirellulales bacterium]